MHEDKLRVIMTLIAQGSGGKTFSRKDLVDVAKCIHDGREIDMTSLLSKLPQTVIDKIPKMKLVEENPRDFVLAVLQPQNYIPLLQQEKGADRSKTKDELAKKISDNLYSLTENSEMVGRLLGAITTYKISKSRGEIPSLLLDAGTSLEVIIRNIYNMDEVKLLYRTILTSEWKQYFTIPVAYQK